MSWTILLQDSLRHWVSARGLALVLVAVLVPPALTGAWVATHQDDVAVTGIAWSPHEPVLGDHVTFNVTVENPTDRDLGPFNVTLRVGFHEDLFGQLRFRDRFNETQRIDGMAPGGTRVVAFPWNTTAGASADRAGSYVVEATVDADDEIQESEERNNHWQEQVRLGLPPGEPGETPELPEPSGGNGTARLEASVDRIRIEPEAPVAGERVNITVFVTNHGPDDLVNATVAVQMVRESPSYRVVDGFLVPEASEYFREFLDSRVVNVSANSTESFGFAVERDLRVAPYLIETVLFTAAVAEEQDMSDNREIAEFRADREVQFVPPPPKATAKDFYRDILSILHLRVLIPLVAILFAAGTLEDERQRGHLPYLLTRPVPRWAMPVSRYLVGSLVAGIAVLLGVVITFLLLLGTPQGTPGFFTWPLLFSWLALLVYGALFTLVGVAVQRPYLVGLLYVLGIESAIEYARTILINDQPIIQEWVSYVSVSYWVQTAFAGWVPGGAFWLEGKAATALIVLIAIGVASIAGAAWWMKRKEFESV